MKPVTMLNMPVQERRPDYVHQLTEREAGEYTREKVFGR